MAESLKTAFPSLAAKWDELTPKLAELESRFVIDDENRMTNAQAREALELMGLSSVLPVLESEEIVGSDPDGETLLLDMGTSDWDTTLSGESAEVLDLIKATVATLKGEFNLSVRANRY